MLVMVVFFIAFRWIHLSTPLIRLFLLVLILLLMPTLNFRSEERFSRNAETDLVCRLLLEKKNDYLVCAVLLRTWRDVTPGDVCEPVSTTPALAEHRVS